MVFGLAGVIKPSTPPKLSLHGLRPQKIYTVVGHHLRSPPPPSHGTFTIAKAGSSRPLYTICQYDTEQL